MIEAHYRSHNFLCCTFFPNHPFYRICWTSIKSLLNIPKTQLLFCRYLCIPLAFFSRQTMHLSFMYLIYNRIALHQHSLIFESIPALFRRSSSHALTAFTSLHALQFLTPPLHLKIGTNTLVWHSIPSQSWPSFIITLIPPSHQHMSSLLILRVQLSFLVLFAIAISSHITLSMGQFTIFAFVV